MRDSGWGSSRKNERSEEGEKPEESEKDLTGLGNGSRGPTAWLHLYSLIGFKNMAAENCPQGNKTVLPTDLLAFCIGAWTV